jgi:hypothetical protein
VLSGVMEIASHTGFVIRRHGEVFTQSDADALIIQQSDVETFLDFAVTDGDLSYVYSVAVSEILSDPITVLARLGKLAAALTEFTFGE